MKKIKDFFVKAQLETIEFGEYPKFVSKLEGIGVNLQLKETDFEVTYVKDSIMMTPLNIGDIVIKVNDPSKAKLINSLPNFKIYAGKKYIVLRKNPSLPETEMPPSWSIVLTARQDGHLWGINSMGTYNSEKILMEHPLKVIPNENLTGIKLLDHAEKLLDLKDQAIKTMEKIYKAIAYRMLNNLPLSGEFGPVLELLGAYSQPAKESKLKGPTKKT